jgi:aspartyl protease family protein
MKWLPWIALVVGGLALMFRGEAQALSGLDEIEFAQALIGVTLAAFIGTAVLAGYRGQMATLARQLGVWALVAAGLAGGYSYKSEVAELAHRITGELMPPGETQTVEPRTTGEMAVRIRRRGDGHFVAKLKIGSNALNALVDTGASTVVLRAADAKAIGLDIDRLSYTVPVQTANGIAYAAAVRLPQVSIGPLQLEGVDALVARPGALKESLLGISFLRRLRSYEFSGDFLTLRG